MKGGFYRLCSPAIAYLISQTPSGLFGAIGFIKQRVGFKGIMIVVWLFENKITLSEHYCQVTQIQISNILTNIK